MNPFWVITGLWEGFNLFGKIFLFPFIIVTSPLIIIISLCIKEDYRKINRKFLKDIEHC